jgi:hypothetical protein
MSEIEFPLSTVPMPREDEIAALRRLLYEKYGESENLKKIQAQLVEDLEKALNLVVAYQRCLRILRSPDPNFVDARRLLIKYKMKGVEPAGGYKVYADGVDITLHPDSIEATVVDEVTVEGEIVTRAVPMLDLPEDAEWADEQGTETAELIADEHGNLRLRPVKPKRVDCTPTLIEGAEEVDGELDPATREWLTEEVDDEPDH